MFFPSAVPDLLPLLLPLNNAECSVHTELKHVFTGSRPELGPVLPASSAVGWPAVLPLCTVWATLLVRTVGGASDRKYRPATGTTGGARKRGKRAEIWGPIKGAPLLLPPSTLELSLSSIPARVHPPRSPTSTIQIT